MSSQEDNVHRNGIWRSRVETPYVLTNRRICSSSETLQEEGHSCVQCPRRAESNDGVPTEPDLVMTTCNQKHKTHISLPQMHKALKESSKDRGAQLRSG